MEVWVDGAKRFEADVHLTSARLWRKSRRWAVPNPCRYRRRGMVGSVGWPPKACGALHAEGEFELRLLHKDLVGRAVLPNGRDVTYLNGLGDPPF